MSTAEAAAQSPARGIPPDTARQILAGGNAGAVPPPPLADDQARRYDALTPLRDRVTDQDIQRLFLPLDLRPIGSVQPEDTGRPDVDVVYDAQGIPHVHGRTRAGLMFGAGWTAARDRGLLLQQMRYAARIAAVDVPGLSAIEVVVGLRTFVPSAETEALLRAQQDVLVRTYGEEGRQILRDAGAFADGVNAFWTRTGDQQAPFTVSDVIAITAFVGATFGAGGGREHVNADLLAKLRSRLGPLRGFAAWDDVMLSDDPETPTTTRRRFEYGPLTGGPVRGSVVPDPGSLQEVGPASPAQGPRLASSFLLVNRPRSATGNTLGVMGPQIDYTYPSLVHQIALHGPGIEAQGVAVTGLELYLLIGRTRDYAWTLASSGADTHDVFAEELCRPGGGAPSRASTHYVFRGQCRPMRTFTAGTIEGQALSYPTTVHGSVIGTFTAGGRPFALARQRSTHGRDVLNLAALKAMTEGRAQRPQDFAAVADRLEYAFNWGYQSRDTIAFFSAGRLPLRAAGLDRRLPTLGTGGFEWRGFLSQREHPQDVGGGGPNGVLLNWSNAAAPGFMHGDDRHAYGPVQRVQMLEGLPQKSRLRDLVAVMNRAATQDFRATHVWPAISAVLRTGPAPDARTRRAAQLVDTWAQAGASRLDADLDGRVDDPGAPVLDAAFGRLADAVMGPVFGPLLSDLSAVQPRDTGAGGAAWATGWYPYVVKDLRTLLGARVNGPFNLRYCGAGALAACRASLWQALGAAADELAAAQGPDPAAWRADAIAERIAFSPGILPFTMRWTNRPTYQQVLELARR